MLDNTTRTGNGTLNGNMNAVQTDVKTLVKDAQTLLTAAASVGLLVGVILGRK